jgi:hypothetical protein
LDVSQNTKMPIVTSSPAFVVRVLSDLSTVIMERELTVLELQALLRASEEKNQQLVGHAASQGVRIIELQLELQSASEETAGLRSELQVSAEHNTELWAGMDLALEQTLALSEELEDARIDLELSEEQIAGLRVELKRSKAMVARLIEGAVLGAVPRLERVLACCRGAEPARSELRAARSELHAQMASSVVLELSSVVSSGRTLSAFLCSVRAVALELASVAGGVSAARSELRAEMASGVAVELGSVMASGRVLSVFLCSVRAVALELASVAGCVGAAGSELDALLAEARAHKAASKRIRARLAREARKREAEAKEAAEKRARDDVRERRRADDQAALQRADEARLARKARGRPALYVPTSTMSPDSNGKTDTTFLSSREEAVRMFVQVLADRITPMQCSSRYSFTGAVSGDDLYDLVRLYRMDVLGPHGDIQLERLGSGAGARYRLVFAFDDLPSPVRYATRRATLETMVTWLDQRSLRESCQEMFAFPRVRECEASDRVAAYRSTIQTQFDAIKADPIFREGKLSLHGTGTIDGFGLEGLAVDTRNDDGYFAIMRLSAAQLVLWYHMGKIKHLSERC